MFENHFPFIKTIDVFRDMAVFKKISTNNLEKTF